ncbi:MAG: hypothetical protein GXO82_07310 [Chlorobi bacterium]|nr:hypothetical protein [Chlorobiota bacterium]
MNPWAIDFSSYLGIVAIIEVHPCPDNPITCNLTSSFLVCVFTGKAAACVGNLVEDDELSFEYAPFREILFWHGFGGIYSRIGNGSKRHTREPRKKEMKK